MSSSVRLSVTFVRPTQAIEIFGNIFTSFGTLAIYDLCIKILRRSSQGNPSVGGVKQKTLNGVMAVTLRYFTEFGKPALQKMICGGIYARVVYFVVQVQCRRKESSRSHFIS